MAHIGTRIRDRRLAIGLSQTDFAGRLGISGSYLNLIEHNRRRIGPKLLEDIARVLMVDAATLDAGAGPEVVAALEVAGKAAGLTEPDLGQATDLATRFPRWADLLATQASVIAGRVEDGSRALNDIVSAIVSTSQALVDMPDLPEDWQDRFARRIAQDSRQLHNLLLRAQPRAEAVDPWQAANDALNDRNWHKAFLAGEEVGFAGLEVAARERANAYLSDMARVFNVAQRQEIARAQMADLRGLGLPLAQSMQLHAEISADAGLVRMDARGRVMRFKPLTQMQNVPDCLIWPVHAEELALARPVTRIVQSDGVVYQVMAMTLPRILDQDDNLPRDRMMVWQRAKNGQMPDVIACTHGVCRH